MLLKIHAPIATTTIASKMAITVRGRIMSPSSPCRAMLVAASIVSSFSNSIGFSRAESARNSECTRIAPPLLLTSRASPRAAKYSEWKNTMRVRHNLIEDRGGENTRG